MTRIFLAAVLALAAAPASGDEFPFGNNGGPLARGFALPALGAVEVPRRGSQQSRVAYEWINEYVREGNCAIECLVQDGELRRLRIDWRVGLGGGLEFSTHVPMVSRSGGRLDGLIEKWHGWFGLPNGGRELVPRDQFNYRYEQGGVPLLDETAGANGLGDIGLGLGYALGARAALRTYVKLPTGDDERLSGGNVGGAAWLDMALPVPAGWSGYFSAGYSRNERGEVLTALQNQEVVFGGLGLLAPFLLDSRLLLMANAHSQLYDGSNLTPLARKGVPLTIGLQFRTAGGLLDVGVQEDASVTASPDFVVYFSWASAPAPERRRRR